MSACKAYLNREVINLSEVSSIERAKKGKKYQKGCTLIPLSAAAPELIRYLDNDGEVNTRFAVVLPKTNVNPYYLYIAIQNAAEEFFWKYQTGINLQYDIFCKYFKIIFHRDRRAQDRIVAEVRTINNERKAAEKELAFYQGLKKTMLNLLFP